MQINVKRKIKADNSNEEEQWRNMRNMALFCSLSLFILGIILGVAVSS